MIGTVAVCAPLTKARITHVIFIFSSDKSQDDVFFEKQNACHIVGNYLLGEGQPVHVDFRIERNRGAANLLYWGDYSLVT